MKSITTAKTFKSSVHPFFDAILIGLPVLMVVVPCWMAIDSYLHGDDKHMWSAFAMVIIFGLFSLVLLDARFNTHYILYENHLIAKCGIHSQTVFYRDITQISYPKHVRPVGFRPDLDFTGLLMVYNEGHQILLTPEDRDGLIEEILLRNPKISVFRKTK